MTGIRPMTTQDLAAGMQLCRLSSWNQLEEDWRCFLEGTAGSGWLAEQDGVAIGTVATLRYRPGFSWLSMMLVDPAYRRTGVGSQLLATALEALTDEKCVRLDATPAGEPLYRRFGFVPEYPLTRATTMSMRTALPPGIRAMTTADLPSILARDHEIFGADRSSLLTSFYHRAPELAAIAPGAGYCFGRPGRLYHQLGPLVAEEVAAAQDLVACCLARRSGPIAIDATRFSPQWIAWLQSAGFAIERPFLRMRRGEISHPGQAERQFAIAGPEFG
jgi:GNAT superfamily N-acetyltransferase